MQLVKYHGLGNDYLVTADPAAVPQAAALCERHRGVGADGLVVARREGSARLAARIFNPDGSEAERSGNGLRILAAWAVAELGMPDRMVLVTSAGPVRARVLARRGPETDVELAMGRATLEPAEVPVASRRPLLEATLEVADGERLAVTAVGVGNPHAVVAVEGDLDALPWPRWGRALEVHPSFPRRTNVQVYRVLDAAERHLEARVWERGVGPTESSGTSACAVAVASVVTGRTASGPHRVRLPGGELVVDVGPGLELRLAGPVRAVARIEVPRGWL